MAHPGDQAERFMRLFLAEERRFFMLLLSLSGNVADAEDLLQEMSVLMWQKFNEFEPETNFVAWGCCFARNVAMNFVRKKRALGEIAFTDELMESVADEAMPLVHSTDQRYEALVRCINKLPERARQVLELRYEPGATVKSLAARMGKPISAIYKTLERIQDALLQCMEQTFATRGEP